MKIEQIGGLHHKEPVFFSVFSGVVTGNSKSPLENYFKFY